MSDTTADPDDRPEVDAIGLDPDFVTTDDDLAPEDSSPAEESTDDDDEVDVSDLP